MLFPAFLRCPASQCSSAFISLMETQQHTTRELHQRQRQQKSISIQGASAQRLSHTVIILCWFPKSQICPAQVVFGLHTHTRLCVEVGGVPQRLGNKSRERFVKALLWHCGFILFFHDRCIPPKLDKRILMGRLMDCD